MQLAQSLEQLHRYLTRRWADDTLRPGGLSFSEYGYLRALERLDGAQIAESAESADPEGGQHGHHLQELVEVMGVQKASASAAMAKMEKNGFVVRFPCQFDARAQHIVLTENGHDRLREEQAVYDTVAAELEDRLTSQEAKTLKALLAKALKSK